MSRPDHALRERWKQLLRPLGCPVGATEQAFDELASAYCSPERHYHTLEHIAAVLATIDRIIGSQVVPPALLLAAWLHDVVYDPRTADNEERSADHARSLRHRLGLDHTLIEEVARLILLTKSHQTTDDDATGQVLLDADLAILGASPEEYDRYAHAIRREYAWVPDEAYHNGRAGVLKKFLQRPRVFRTAILFEQAEAQARENMARELRSLEA